jgi:hypothetical protein
MAPADTATDVLDDLLTAVHYEHATEQRRNTAGEGLDPTTRKSTQ